MPLPKRKYHKRGELVHGFLTINHPLYRTWHNMLKRCYDEKQKQYLCWGGRGITVCDDWLHFANFANDMGLKPSKHHSLERINNDAGYSKSNCMWATRTQQCLNRRMFKNNTTGATGVRMLKNGTYQARFDYECARYDIGRFSTKSEAVEARERFVKIFKIDRRAALELIPKETISLTSTTGLRGVTPHKDGGYIVRKTINGVRTYLGYFKTIEEAVNAKNCGN